MQAVTMFIGLIACLGAVGLAFAALFGGLGD